MFLVVRQGVRSLRGNNAETRLTCQSQYKICTKRPPPIPSTRSDGEVFNAPLNAAQGFNVGVRVGRKSAISPLAKFWKDNFIFARSRYSLHCFCHLRMVELVFAITSKKWSWSKERKISTAPAGSEGSTGGGSSNGTLESCFKLTFCYNSVRAIELPDGLG